MDKKIVLFDFDGVIVDSFSLALSINQECRPGLTEEKYRQNFQGNINEEIKREGYDESYEKKYFKQYAVKLPSRKLVEGIANVIKELSKKYLFIIVSSATTEIIKDYLKLNGLSDYFADVYGNDVNHSKVRKFNMIFNKYSIVPSEAVFITDTLGDLKEANEVGLESIAVTWGFHFRDTLKLGKPRAILGQPKDIIIEIDNFFNQSKI